MASPNDIDHRTLVFLRVMSFLLHFINPLFREYFWCFSESFSKSKELMLNAVALNAILDVDEFLFAGFTPMSIHLAIQRLEPMQMKYTARRNKIESFFLFFVLLVTFLVPYLVLLRPQADAMLSVKQELCFGNQTFVVGQNQQSQVIFGLVTEDIPEGGRQNSALSPIERAVDIHKFADPHEEAYYIGFVQSRNAFEIERTRSMASEAAEFNLCLEQAYLTEGGEWYQDAAVGALTMFRLRTAAAVLGRFDHITNCQQVADLCNLPEARLLRMVCGVTCHLESTSLQQIMHLSWFWVKKHGNRQAWGRFFTVISSFSLSQFP